MKKRNISKYFLFLLSAPLFVACGDENTTKVEENYYDAMSILEKGKKLSQQPCDSLNVGDLLYVTDSSEVFFCNGKEWLTLKGDAGKKGDKGDRGAKGAKGDAGAPGSSGSAGPVGSSGANGTGCEIVDDEGGIVTIECGDESTELYRAMCANKPYDPDEFFCMNETLYDPANYFVDSRDNHVYRKIKVGKGKNAMVWMAENLNYAYNEGSAKSVCFDNNLDNCAKYGRLYTWAAAVDSAGIFSDDCIGCGNYLENIEEESNETKKWVEVSSNTIHGVCPKGWHLPDTAEYRKLLESVADTFYVNMVMNTQFKNAGRRLQSTYGWENEDGEDSIAFSALAAGYGFVDDDKISFYLMGSKASFWTTIEYNGCSVKSAEIWSLGDGYITYTVSKSNYYSIRCVKD